MDNKTKKHCAICGKPTTLNCGGCRMTSYCDAECQKMDWSKHKKICNGISLERTIQRVAHLLQDVFLLFCEKTYDCNTVKIEDTGKVLYLYDGPFIPGIYIPFPNHLVGNEKDKRMVLCTLMCAEPIAYLHDFLSELLEGTGVKLHEVVVQLKDPDRRTRLATRKATMEGAWLTHNVLKVMDPSSSKMWIFDITGAQYNIFSPCHDALTYQDERCEKIISVVQPGTEKLIYEKIATLKGNLSLSARQSWSAIGALHRSVDSWKASTGLTLAKLLRQSENMFLKTRQEVLDNIGMALETFVAEADFSIDIQATQKYEALHHSQTFTEVNKVDQEIRATRAVWYT